MALRPGSALLTFASGAVSIPTYINEAARKFDVIDFDRNEFSNAKLAAAKNSLGGQPIVVRNVANTPIQVNIACSGDTARPFAPDDSNIPSIKQRFNVQKYTITSALNPYGVCDTLEAIYTVQRKLLDKFALYQEESTSMDLSYTFLLGLQAETFSYLTSTSASMTGNCIGGTISNLLISDFAYTAEIEVKNADGSTSLMRAFTMVVENRQIVSRTTST